MDNKPGITACVSRMMICLSLTWLPLSAVGVTLTKMEAETLPGDIVELKLTFDGEAPKAKGYAIEKPPRVSIDLPHTESDLPKYNTIGIGNVRNVTVLETRSKTRLVVNLSHGAGYATKIDNNLLYVYLGSKGITPKMDEPSVSKSGAPVAVPPGRGVTHIDFKRSESGDGNVVISLSDADIPMDISDLGGRIRIEFQGDVLPGKLRNRLDVIDFATPVKYIDAKVEEGNGVVTIEPKGKYSYLAWQSDNTLTVSVKQESDRDYGRNSKKAVYVGDKMSLNFQDVEVRAVLQIIADFTGMNLVASDTVSGNVTLHLKDVPWDQALDIVLKSKGLDKRLENNVLTIAPAEEIAARERQQLENSKQIRELAPVYTHLVQINYADAADIAKVLSGTGENASLLTSRGSVQVVDRTNSLLIKETQSKLDELQALIKRLDVPVRQVMIEARIVNIDSNYEERLGVNWNVGSSSDGASKNDPSIDFGATGETGIKLGLVANTTILNLELSALLSDKGGETISQPKIVTADKTTAVIKSGQEIPYEEKTSSGATSTAFKDATLSLEVTPQITPEGSIIMKVNVTNDSVSTTERNGVPLIDTNVVNTQVLVRDGETVVLGGVYTTRNNDTVTKVPLLGDIPGLGKLFRNKNIINEKSELMIFITPRVINESLVLR